MQSIKDAELLLNKLGLHGMQLGLSGVKVESDNTGFYTQLVNLLQKEMEYKKSRSLNYRLKLAKLPQVKLLTDTKAANLVATIDVAKAINNKENLFFIGGSGSAKTHLAIGLGYVPIDKKAGILLFELFAKLYEQTSLFITTHLKFDEWNDMFGDIKATKAIIDRLTHHCHVIETGNISYRMKGGTEIH